MRAKFCGYNRFLHFLWAEKLKCYKMKMKTLDSTLIFLLKKVEAAYYNCTF